ncbi:hypothetical protein SteCoe_7634 [Stentor coeruleus]|uniref:USP domain-containing protein n=1 Tax=Stentor coeruleus TaxID=5963 RepID=A0A1R2CM69_9CILI|nr:hypothetical protein SteCoe_7634 [Stentor coeruleus]
MKEDLKIQDLQVREYLSKTNLQPSKFIDLITIQMNNFSQSMQTENFQSSFPSQLLVYTNKILNRKYQSFTDMKSISTFLIQIMDYSLTHLQSSTLDFLNILTSLLSTQSKFYNKYKNLIPSSEDLKLQEELQNEEFFSIKFFNPSSYNLSNTFCMYNFNYFVKLDGISKFISHIQSRPNLEDISLILKIFQDIKTCIFEDIWKQASKSMVFEICQMLKGLRNEDVKNIQKDTMIRFMKTFESFLIVRYGNNKKSAEIIECCELEIALSFLRSSYLEKKLLGIEEINRKTRQTRNKMNAMQKRQGGYFDEYSKYLNEEMLRSWMEENTLFDELYGPTCHPEIINRSTDTAHFLLQDPKLSQSRINFIWENAMSRYQAYKDSMLNLLEGLIYKLTDKDLNFICQKIILVPHSQLNFHLLQIIKSFNFNLCKKNATDEYENFNPFSYLKFLWEICQGETDEPACEEISIKAFTLLRDSLCHHVFGERKTFISLCLENIRNVKNVSFSCDLLREIIDSFSRVNIPTEKYTVIQAIRDYKDEILTSIIKSFVVHKKIVIGYLKNNGIPSTQQLNQTHWPSINLLLKNFLQNKKNYIQDLTRRFELLKFCLANNPDFINNFFIKKIWLILVENSLSDAESDTFYNFLSNLLGNPNKEILNKNLLLQIFTDFILSISPEYYSITLYNCFEKYFIQINKNLKFALKSANDGTFQVLDIEMPGLEYLWEIALTCQNDEVFLKSCSLIKRLYTRQKNVTIESQLKLVSYCLVLIQNLKNDMENEENEKNVNKICRCLEIAKDYLVNTTFKEFSTDDSLGVQVRIANKLSKSFCCEYFNEDFFNTTLWQSAKEVIAEKLSKRCEDLSFKINGKVVYGNDDKNLGELGVGMNTEIEVNENTNILSRTINSESVYMENVHQLKNIFDDLEDSIIFMALEKTQNDIDNAVVLLTDENFIQTSRSELYEKNVDIQINKPESTVPQQPQSVPIPKKPSILKSLSNDNDFFKLLFNISDSNIDSINKKIIELIAAVGRSEHDYNMIYDIDFYSPKEMLISHNKVKLLNSLEIIMEIINSDNQNNWMNRFFEFGGFIYLCKLVLKFRKYGLDPINEINEKCFVIIINLILKYINAITGPDSEFSVAIDLIDIQMFIENLISVIEMQIDKPNASENLIEKTLNLLIALAKHRSDIYSDIYRKNVFENLILSTLLKSQSSSLRDTIKNSIQTLLQSLPYTLQETILPNQHFWNLISNNLPTSSNLDCDEFFDLALAILETNPEVSPTFLQNLIEYLISKTINENNTQDKIVTGYLKLITSLIKNNEIIESTKLIIFIYNCLFDVNFTENTLQTKNIPPLFKNINTRIAGLNLLILLSQKSSSNFIFLSEKISSHHPYTSLTRTRDYENTKKSSTGFVGLRNFGSTCYMNSLMQQLFMIKPFSNGLLSIEHTSTNYIQDNLLYQMQILMANLRYSEKQCFEPRGICNTFKIDGQIVNVRIQQDADEFLNLLFDKLEELLKETQYPGLIRSIIGGSIVHEIKSLEENFPYEGEREEHFFRLSLEVKNNKSLADALDLYIKEDILEGDNKYLCEEYNAKITATKRCVIFSLSNTIFIHLKRFEFNFADMRRIKINDKFEFPMEISFKKWCKDQDKDEGYYDYDLVGVIVHSGTADSGHYYSFIKNRSNKIWFKFDDRYVDFYNIENLSRDCFGGEAHGPLRDDFQYDNYFSAYILVYERKNPLSIHLEHSGGETISLSNNIINDTISENITFLQDSIYFESNYENFLKQLFVAQPLSENFVISEEDSLGLQLQEELLVTQAILNNEIHVNDLNDSNTRRIITEKLTISIKNKDPSIKFTNSCLVYALELLFKLQKYEDFKYWKSVLLNNFNRTPISAVWACNLFLTAHSITIKFLEDCKSEDTKNDLMEFISSIINISSKAEQRFLTSKVKVIQFNESYFHTDSLIYVNKPISSSRRLLQLVMSDLWGKYQHVGSFAQWMLWTIKTFMDQGLAQKETLCDCGTGSFIALYTIKNSLPNGVIPSLSFHIIEQLMIYCKENKIYPQTFLETNPEFFDNEIIANICAFNQLITFSAIRLYLCYENYDYYKKIMSEMIVNVIRNKNDLKVNLFLNEIRKLLIAEDSRKTERVEFLFKEMHFLPEKGGFFDEIRVSYYPNYNFSLVVVLWWSNLMNDLIIEKVSLENQRTFIFVENMMIINGIIDRNFFKGDVNLEMELEKAKQKFRRSLEVG